jgi:hypothetical protein
MAGIGMKDGDQIRFGGPIRSIVNDQLKMEQRSGQVTFERERADAEDHIHIGKLDRNIDMKRADGRGHREILMGAMCLIWII